MDYAWGTHSCKNSEDRGVEITRQYPTTPWVMEIHLKERRGWYDDSSIELTIQQEVDFCPYCGEELK